jgi:stage II sporulation protein D
MSWRFKYSAFLAILCLPWLALGQGLDAQPTLRVRLYSPYTMTTASLGGGALHVLSFQGAKVDTVEASNAALRVEGSKLQINVEGSWLPVDSARIVPETTLWVTGARGIRRLIPGPVVVRPRGQALQLVGVLNMDDYLTGVVHAELGGLIHPALWEAQAIVARTWFARNARKFYDQGECYAVTDDVQSQVFHGWPSDTVRCASLQSAVRASKHRVVVNAKNEVIEALFHANSGGQTMPSGWYFTPRAHLSSVVDSFSLSCPQTYWTKKLDKEAYIAQMARWLKASPSDKAFRMYVCTYRQPERAEYLYYGGQKVRLRTVREHFTLRSTWFSVEDGTGTLMLHGRGYGHGIGMSQEGAYAMAKRKYAAEEIISFYYPGTHLTTWSEATHVK